MARSPWLAPVAILLLVITFFTGCMSTAPRGLDDRATVSADESGTTPEGAQKARGHHGGAVAALFFVGAILIVGAVIVDLIILPCTAPCHRSFCCTETVVVHCYH